MQDSRTPERQRDQLAAAVVKAFDGVPRPSRAEIAPHDCDDCQKVSAALAPWTWDTLPDHVIEENHSKLPLLSPAARVYFLPAYLRYSLRHFTRDSLVTEFLIYDLTPRADSDEDWWRERLRPITADQMEVLGSYMDLVVADESLRSSIKGLASGWERFQSFWADRWA